MNFFILFCLIDVEWDYGRIELRCKYGVRSYWVGGKLGECWVVGWFRVISCWGGFYYWRGWGLGRDDVSGRWGGLR